MKKYLLLIILVFFTKTPLFAQFGGGTGTQTAPYLIYDKSHLQEMADSAKADDMKPIGSIKWANGKHFRLAQDIDNVTQRVTINSLFTHNGGFHGGGNKITVAMHHILYVNSNGSLFGQAYGTYDSLIVDGYIIDGYAGIVYGVNAAAWDNSYPASVVSNSTSNVIINAIGGAGGIARSNRGTVINCVNNGSIDGKNGIGGIVGSNENEGIVINCLNTGRITATNSGSNVSSIIGNPTSSNGVGGIIGYTGNGCKSIFGNINTGTIEGQGMVGGIIGTLGGSFMATPVINNFNYGFVKGINKVGGIVGWCSRTAGIVSNNFNSGVVVGGEDTGCIVGKNEGSNISNNHYDKQMCGE